MPFRLPLSRRQFLIRTSAFGATALLGACAAEDAETGNPADVGDGGTGPGPDAASDANLPEDTMNDTDTMGACVGSVTLSFVHVNDLHGAYNPDDAGISPVSRIVGFAKAVRAENPNTLFTNAGDDFEKGSVAEFMSEGRATLEVAKALKFDVRCIGNHDFAWSVERMLEYSDDPTGETISSNVSYSGPTPERWKAQSTVIREVGCVRVGFFGMVGKPWNEFNEQYEGNFFPEFPMRHDYVERAQELVAELREQVDVLIMLSHLGLGTDVEIAGAVDGIDLILGGHSHSVLAQEQVVNGTVIIQAGASAAWIARLDVDVDRDTREITGYRYELALNAPGVAEPDAETNAAVLEILARLAPDALTTVGRSSQSLTQVAMMPVMARAAASILEADAAVVDRETAWVAGPRGPATPQNFADIFKVERQPSGTPGFNSFGTGRVTGAVLMQVRDQLPEDWGFVGPEMIDPAASYTLAVQRNVAGRMEANFGAGAAIADYTLRDECWAILTEWSRQQSSAGRYIDSDEFLPD